MESGKRKHSEAESVEASSQCLVMCRGLSRDIHASVELANVATAFESFLVGSTLKECNHIESLRISSGFPEPTYWKYLEDFLEHALLKQVVLHNLLPGDLLAALARNRKVIKVCLTFTFQLPAPALATFLQNVCCVELELRIQTVPDSADLAVLGTALERNPFLRHVSILNWHTGHPESLPGVMLRSLPRQLEKLCLSYGFNGILLHHQWRFLEGICALPCLETLILNYSGMRSEVEKGFLNYLRTTKVLECLILTHIARLSPVCDALQQNPSIKSVTLSVNMFREEMAPVISTFLQQSVHINSFGLAGNAFWKVSDEVISQVASGLGSSQSLCSVLLVMPLSSHQLHMVFEGMQKNPRIKKLEICVDLAPLCACLEVNSTLTSLRVLSPNVSEKQFNSLLESLAVNNTLEKLEVTSRSSWDFSRFTCALQRLKALRVLEVCEEEAMFAFEPKQIADVRTLVASSLELNVSLFEVHGSFFERQHWKVQGKIQRILQRNRHLADPRLGDRLPMNVWPILLERPVRNLTAAGRSCVFGHLRNNLKWIQAS